MERSLILTKGRAIIRTIQKFQSMYRPHVMDYIQCLLLIYEDLCPQQYQANV